MADGRISFFVLIAAALISACCSATNAQQEQQPPQWMDLSVGQSQWEATGEDELAMGWDDVPLRPFDWVRHFGFRHSSTHGRNVGRGIPLKGASWRNRPYHISWFLGPLLSDELVDNEVGQDNVGLGGLRIGWDFDYYWGLEWRFGWADPDVQLEPAQVESNSGSFFISDIDLKYYPWGDSKIRPYALLGLGVTEVSFRDAAGINNSATLLTTPFGGGVQFHQTPWLVWRLEALDNLAYGSENISTMHNLSFTVGMELRFGARPASSYWPWRSSRSIW